MLKFSVFTAGLGTGLFLGIYLRENGTTTSLTRAYHAYQNEDSGIKKNPNIKKPDIDDLYDYFNKGLIDDSNFEKFKDIVYTKRYDDIDKVIMRDPKDIMKDPSFRHIKVEKNAFYKEK